MGIAKVSLGPIVGGLSCYSQERGRVWPGPAACSCAERIGTTEYFPLFPKAQDWLPSKGGWCSRNWPQRYRVDQGARHLLFLDSD